MIMQAVHAGFGYFQREAGYTRTGSHRTRTAGQETGQWHEADLAVAHWLQHTSRDGDMQLHVHSQVAHVARTGKDGKWRAPDSLGYNEHVGAVAAITAQHLEEALTARFGLQWAAREDGNGFEISGVSQAMMDLFSSRRRAITADVRQRAARFEQRYGRAPSQRELAQLAQASNFATRRGKEGALDLAQAHAGWADRLARTLGVPLASVAPSVWHADAASAAPDAALEDAARRAMALAQQEKSAWTRADLVKHLGRALPRAGRNPEAAARLLEETADRIVRSEFAEVLCLEAPDPVDLPAGLVRADGRSVYRRHGGTRYATAAQLSMEERMVAQAQATTAPRMSRAAAAAALGADLARLERALTGDADAGAEDAGTGSGLREDQAAAALSVLADGRRASVVNAPPGAGKTRVLAEIARAWQEAGLGPVIGITASQSARNTLAAGGIESYNSARFLGHLPSRRGALGHLPVAQGTLLAVDEASMMTTPDLADLIDLAERHGGKVIIVGDTEQLQAVQNGGGMSLLADRLGYARLTEPVRFKAAWERAASLRLRDGDPAVADEYDRHGRVNGGPPELMTEAAAARYTTLTASGTDALLITADHALRRELSRRVQENLLRLGLVDHTQTVTIAGGAQAGAGDLILCTVNDHHLEAGEPGRTLANGDLLRIDAVTPGGLLVRRALDTDRRTGRRRWTDRQFLYASCQEAELGYAVTGHVAQGRTVRAGLAVLTGSETRQHATVALTRGTDENTVYVFTTPARLADPAPGPRPAPELARYDRLTAQAASPGPHNPDDPGTTSPVTVLAEIIAGRDGALEAAAQAWRQALADADHLAVLHAIWTEQTAPARQQRYRALLQGVLPPGTGPLPPSDKEQWLHRTLRAAELAGLDPAQVLARAVAERDLVGTRDIAAVIDDRIRNRYPDLVPLPAAPWPAQVPETSDPERGRFFAQLAHVMEDRRRRIGEHAAASSLPWAVDALGPVPDDPAERLAWQEKAAAIGAYRELSGHDQPDDPVGPEPPASTPDLRAAWHAAHAALTPQALRPHAEASAAHRLAEHHGAVPQAGPSRGHSPEGWPPDLAETSRRIDELAARHHELATRIAERHSTPARAQTPGPAPLQATRSRTAILQPPRPEIPVSPWILERLASRDLDHEAAD
jgi:hypothetical protein